MILYGIDDYRNMKYFNDLYIYGSLMKVIL